MITSSAPIHHIHSTSTMWRHRGPRASNPTLGHQTLLRCVALHCTPLLTMYTHYRTTRARIKRGPAHMNNEPKTSAHPSSLQRGRLGRARERQEVVVARIAEQTNPMGHGIWGYGPSTTCCTPRGLLEILRLYFLFVSVSVAPA
jgi:hypothetical protein